MGSSKPDVSQVLFYLPVGELGHLTPINGIPVLWECIERLFQNIHLLKWRIVCLNSDVRKNEILGEAGWVEAWKTIWCHGEEPQTWHQNVSGYPWLTPNWPHICPLSLILKMPRISTLLIPHHLFQTIQALSALHVPCILKVCIYSNACKSQTPAPSPRGVWGQKLIWGGEELWKCT